jgi:hypothetical protein
MPQSHTFHITFVTAQHGAGIDPAQQADKVVTYTGPELKVVAP